MTRLVLAILILSTFVVAGILFSPKQTRNADENQKADAWQEQHQKPVVR